MKLQKLFIRFLLLTLIGITVAPLNTYADTARFSILSYKPSLSSHDGFVTLFSKNLEKYQWELSTHAEYSYHSLERTRNGSRIGGIVDHLLVQHVNVSFGLTEWWEMNLDVPMVWVNMFSAPIVPAPAISNKMRLADLLFRNRFTLFSQEKNKIGLAFIPYLTIPTGHEDYFIADRLPTGGALFAADTILFQRLQLGLNVGFEAREWTRFNDYQTGSLFLSSFGLKLDLGKNFYFLSDIATETSFKRFFKDKVTSPTEVFSAFNIPLGKSWTLIPGGSYAIIRGAGVPIYRGSLGISYQFKK